MNTEYYIGGIIDPLSDDESYFLEGAFGCEVESCGDNRIIKFHDWLYFPLEGNVDPIIEKEFTLEDGRSGRFFTGMIQSENGGDLSVIIVTELFEEVAERYNDECDWREGIVRYFHYRPPLTGYERETYVPDLIEFLFRQSNARRVALKVIDAIHRDSVPMCEHLGFYFKSWEEVAKKFEWTDAHNGLIQALHTLANMHVTSQDAKTLPDGTLRSMTIRQPLIALEVARRIKASDESKEVRIAVIAVGLRDPIFKQYQSKPPVAEDGE